MSLTAQFVLVHDVFVDLFSKCLSELCFLEAFMAGKAFHNVTTATFRIDWQSYGCLLLYYTIIILCLYIIIMFMFYFIRL